MSLVEMAKRIQQSIQRTFSDEILSFPVTIRDGRIIIVDEVGSGYGTVISDPSCENSTVIHRLTDSPYVMGKHWHQLLISGRPKGVPLRHWRKSYAALGRRQVETIVVYSGAARYKEIGKTAIPGRSLSLDANIPHTVEFILPENGRFESHVHFSPAHPLHVVSNDGSLPKEFPHENDSTHPDSRNSSRLWGFRPGRRQPKNASRSRCEAEPRTSILA